MSRTTRRSPRRVYLSSLLLLRQPVRTYFTFSWPGCGHVLPPSVVTENVFAGDRVQPWDGDTDLEAQMDDSSPPLYHSRSASVGTLVFGSDELICGSVQKAVCTILVCFFIASIGFAL